MKIALPLLVLLLSAPVFAVPLSVAVVDDQGAPVAGADVQFESFAKAPRGFVVNQTTGEGTATFDVEPEPHSLYGDFVGRIFVKKAGFGIGNGRLLLTTPLRIALAPASKISGVVVDEEGKPIQGATIAFLSAEKTGSGHSEMLIDGPFLPSMTAHSGADGSWQLGGVPANTSIYITVSAPERVGTRTQILAGGNGRTVLPPGAQIEGRLLGLDGKPLASVFVSAQATNTSPHATGSSTKTREDGTFTLDGLSSGTFNIMFGGEIDAPYVIPAFESVSASVGTPLQLSDAHAVEGVLVGGHVLESQSKAPVAGVPVGVYGGVNPGSSAQVAEATTDENGQWKLRTLPEQSKVYIMGVPKEFADNRDQHNLVIGDQGNLDLNFELTRLPTISGRLVDEAGKGVAASVMFQRNEQSFWGSSDEKGDFVAYGPTVGTWKVSAQGKWEMAAASQVLISAGQALEIRLKPATFSSLELGVYDDNDAAIEGAHIIVDVTTGTGMSQMMQQRELVSDVRGLAHIEDLRSDQNVEVRSASKAGYDLATLPPTRHIGQVFSADLTLVKRRGRASGQIFAPDGAVATGARVEADGLDTRTDDTGHFALEPLHNGVTDVVAWQNEGFAIGPNSQTRLDLKPQRLQPTDKARAQVMIGAISVEAKKPITGTATS